MAGGAGCLWQEGEHAWQGGVHGGGHAWQEGACIAEGYAWWGGMHGRTDGHCSVRYASQWNAFLCKGAVCMCHLHCKLLFRGKLCPVEGIL